MKHLFLSIPIACLSFFACAQQRIFMIGINPSVTVEPYYAKGEFDINVLPLVLQFRLTSKADLRVSSLLNLGIRKASSTWSHAGGEIAVVFFPFLPKQTSSSSQGFYIAPVLGLSRNSIARHNNTGIWVEPGYSFSFSKNISLTLGLQFGGTYFNYSETHSPDGWRNHVGVKIILGKWLVH